VKNGSKDQITREPEQVKAFRDTWRDGIHSYLTYLRDRLTVARDLLADSGSIFVQIGDENVHRVRALMDEVFGESNFAALIYFLKTTGKGSEFIDSSGDYILWYARNRQASKVRPAFRVRSEQTLEEQYNMASIDRCEYRRLSKAELRDPSRLSSSVQRFMPSSIYSDSGGQTTNFVYSFQEKAYEPLRGYFWRTTMSGLDRLATASRLCVVGNYLRYRMYSDDYPIVRITNYWDDVRAGGFGEAKIYVVQTTTDVVQRCVLLTTDPGDLVLDPTCGSGTTAYVAEQWGRRWVTIDTSRVALALARARIMGARYPYYLLADSREGQIKEAEVTRTAPKEAPTRSDIRQGFVYERVPHITLKSIANNAEIDVIWEKWQAVLEPLRAKLNAAAGRKWEEWEIAREPDAKWPPQTKALHQEWWDCRIKRQREIDASIAAKAEFEYLFDKPYPDNSRIRVAGPFTVESLSPHRVLAVDQDDELIHLLDAAEGKRAPTERGADEPEFAQVVLDHLKTSGVQQAHKEDRIAFTSVTGWPGNFICAEGRFLEGEKERRAGVFIGPEFGTVSRPDLVAAAREAGDAGFDVLIACAFNFDARSTEFEKLGRIPVLKARMNPDLHMADELKNTGGGNLFVVFGEPDIAIEDAGAGKIQVRIRGVDIFHPQTGEIESGGPDTIALWLIDTDYNEESFFVRHAYFLGSNDPYKALKTTLKAEIDEDAWQSLHSDVSRPFDKPKSGRIAVKVINHLGDEVMKVFGVK
jgi:adenine-specific DNA-methyltransferase